MLVSFKTEFHCAPTRARRRFDNAGRFHLYSISSVPSSTAAATPNPSQAMSPDSRNARRLAGVFLLGWVLLNYPILSLFNHPGTVAGIPLLYAFVFAAWALIVGLAGLVILSGRPPGEGDG
jgi:hypothetical protein